MNYPIIETWNNFYRASEYRISARMLLRDVCPVAAPFYWERRIDRNWNPHVSISRGSLQAPSLRINERAKPRVIISTCPGVIKRPLTVPPSLPPSSPTLIIFARLISQKATPRGKRFPLTKPDLLSSSSFSPRLTSKNEFFQHFFLLFSLIIFFVTFPFDSIPSKYLDTKIQLG